MNESSCCSTALSAFIIVIRVLNFGHSDKCVLTYCVACFVFLFFSPSVNLMAGNSYLGHFHICRLECKDECSGNVCEMKIWMDAYDHVSTSTATKGTSHKNRHSEVLFWWEDSEVFRKHCLIHAQNQLSKTVRKWVSKQIYHLKLWSGFRAFKQIKNQSS